MSVYYVALFYIRTKPDSFKLDQTGCSYRILVKLIWPRKK